MEYELSANTWAPLTTGVDGLTVPTYLSEPTDGKYGLTGTTSKKVRLIIVSTVKDQDYVGTITTYRNTATLTWDGKPSGEFSSSADVGIGIDGLTKGHVSTDYEKRQITWTATVDLKKQTGFANSAEIKVYDLLIYGDSVTLASTNLSDLVGSEYAKLKPKYGQKHVVSSFVGTDLAAVIEPVTVNGERVGDLLVVSGFDTAKAYPFTFKTQVLDPNIFAANADKKVYNTASLYYDGKHLDDGDANTTYTSNVLSKQVLKADGSAVGDKTNGFNHADKTAVFRLNINTEGFDLTGAEISGDGSKKLGNVTVTDTLPTGWSFVDIASGVQYELYTKAGVKVTDVTAILETPVISGINATFVFKNLDKAYYILVKAKLSEEKYLEYLKTSYEGATPADYQIMTNTVKMTATGDTSWDPERKEQVQVPTQFLVKNLNAGKNPVEWTIKFNPYDLVALEEVKITDKIPEGLELALKQDGTLDYTTFTITAYDNMLDGKFPTTGGSKLTLEELKTQLSYDKATRVLTFTPTAGKLYQIVYQTEVTGNVGANLKNEVKVSGSEINGTGTDSTYKVADSHASATLERNGSLNIHKVDGENRPLAGAVFTLYADEALTIPVRSSVVRPDGTLRISAIPAPKAAVDDSFTYYLKETTTPSGYKPDNRVYVVTVAKGADGRAVTTVEGRTAGETLTVVNHAEGTVGDLTITKTLAGNDTDPEKDFAFTAKFTGAGVDGTYAATHTDKDNATSFTTVTIAGDETTFTLKGSERITIHNLPKDTSYEVIEDDYTGDGYTMVSTGESGVIVADTTKEAVFTNTKRRSSGGGDITPTTGSLTISKTVTGEGADRNKKFAFTVTLIGASGSYAYSGASSGTLRSGDKILLAHGESITITGLPQGADFTVTEADYTKDGYVVTSTGDSGAVAAKGNHTAAFTNTKQPEKLGSLTIRKTVAGEAGEQTRKFTFTVVLTDAPGAYPYTGAVSGALRSGDKVLLAHNESITITGLPEGTKYAVIEAEYAADGYVVTSIGASGTIAGGTLQTAAFTNTKNTQRPERPDEPDETEIDGEVPTGGLNRPNDDEELYEFDEDVPRGYMRGPDGKLYKILGYDANGMPITGDESSGTGAGLAIVLLSLMLGGLIYADVTLRRKKRDSA